MSTELKLKIDSLTYGPYGIGRDNRRVILVPLTVPGDEAGVRIVAEKRNYAIGELSHLLKPSPLRQAPPCPYFERCGGCPWQQIEYEGQLAAKEKIVVDALHRIGRLDGFQILPILRSPQEYGYRRRIRLQSDGRKRLGFYRALSHELIEIDSCLIADPQVDRHLSVAREWIKGLRTKLRFVEIIMSDGEQQTVLVGRSEERFFQEDDALCAPFVSGQKEIKGVIISGPGWHRSWGRTKIHIQSQDDLIMEVDGNIFTQVNREGNNLLVGEILQWGEFDHQDRVLELYSGTGNLSLPAARRAGEIVAVDGNPQSIRNGKENGRLNRIENIRWLCSDVPKAVRRLVTDQEQFSKIILNPPRSGAKGLEHELASLNADKILYVSCNPPTLARDLSALSKKGYRLTRVRPIDLFPHTFHVEVLSEMVR
ncbi:MAG: 23S rRNA (uracil(1939)-C(5))-methyltransferase RlmD [Deltaproteobacteria bacterium]|nr:23S rRNA (uracil(1939)-C(5))-methyltransferase RlmD [Deltaproteobacteria bacterium]MCZ6548698.1 23S rRNA (uracil(1939)-C(5))-methyltransferase RlmD [Deltaproteobacteria bacterium]MCZ6564339.1 23S rRNA (uracil(1939)-C(5))-methyltransferase RlmD [Deltaproteobacteria bacterium]